MNLSQNGIENRSWRLMEAGNGVGEVGELVGGSDVGRAEERKAWENEVISSACQRSGMGEAPCDLRANLAETPSSGGYGD